MHRRQHLRQFVKIAEIFKCWAAALIIQIAQIGCPRHRNKDRMVVAERKIIVRVAGVIGKV